MQMPKQLFLKSLKCHIQPLQLLHCILVIHKQPIIQIKAVPRPDVFSTKFNKVSYPFVLI
ncbi:unnamed protein product, partial [Prunus brigantina]